MSAGQTQWITAPGAGTIVLSCAGATNGVQVTSTGTVSGALGNVSRAVWIT
jgi:hypothetical protein